MTAWARRANRLSAVEAGLRLAAVAVLGLCPVVVLALWFPSRGMLVLGVAWALLVLVLTGVALLLRSRRSDVDAAELARELDRWYGTDELFETALGVEQGWAIGTPELTSAVLLQARLAMQRADPTEQRPFSFPWSALGMALLGLGVAAPIGLAPFFLLAPSEPQAVEPDALPPAHSFDAPASVSVASRGALSGDAKVLQQQLGHPALSDSGRSAVERAVESLDEAGEATGTAREYLATLAAAEVALDKLSDLIDRDELMSDEVLAALPDRALVKALARALERGDGEDTLRLAEQLQGRLDRASLMAARGLGQAAGEALNGVRPGKYARPDDTPEARASEHAVSEAARGVEDAMQKAATGHLSEATAVMADVLADMGEAAEYLPRTAEGEVDEAKDHVLEAKAMQMLATQGAGGGGRRAGEASGESKSSGPQGSDGGIPLEHGEGAPDNAQLAENMGSTPGGLPGAQQVEGGTPMGTELLDGMAEGPVSLSADAFRGGGQESDGTAGAGPGAASRDPSDDLPLPEPAEAPELWVQSVWDGHAQGAVRSIEGVVRQEHSGADWHLLQQTYGAIAEQAMRREDIPLTRRDYIREYFVAIRPPSKETQ